MYAVLRGLLALIRCNLNRLHSAFEVTERTRHSGHSALDGLAINFNSGRLLSEPALNRQRVF